VTTLISTREGAITTLTINREKALNALNAEVVRELLEVDVGDARVVILTGAGEKAFVAGADIAAMAGMTSVEARDFARRGGELAHAIETSPRVWIAMVNGFALGGGCELALACDFIYASRNAKLGQPEVNLGVIPGFGGTQRLSRRVGVAKARELIYTGDIVGAEEALRIGLVDLVVDPAELAARTRQTAEKIAQKGPLAIAQAKRVIREGQNLPLEQACQLEAEAFASLFDTADQKEGMKAFLEKRPAKFVGN
jgi:enoyl-CoA hydratase